MSERVLLFDVETTGKADMKASVTAPHQPRIVQLAALLIDGERELACLNVVIKPEGFLIPQDAAKIHGITDEIAWQIGVYAAPTLAIFNDLINHADWIVGHNIPFDIFCAQVELSHRGYANPFADKPTFCTMRSSTDICKLPGPYGYKWPKLSEVYKFAFQEDLQNSHNAMVDLRATLRVYNWLKDLLATKATEGVPA